MKQPIKDERAWQLRVAPLIAGSMLAAMTALGITAWPQSQSETPTAKSFEVASIRPSEANARRTLTVTPGGRFSATATTLRALIMFAYNVGPDRLTGADGWMESQRFDVNAKPPDGAIQGAVGQQAQWTGPNGQSASWTALPAQSQNARIFRAMMQNLLADRFQLKIHEETRQLPVYALVVAKGGPKLAEAKGAADLHMSSGGAGHMNFEAAPMSTLAVTLTWMTGRPVLDQTGLLGNYDFSLNWSPDDGQMQTYRGGGGGAADGTAAADPAAPSLFTAVEEQLGLRLESTRGPVHVFAVDHAEKPSEN